MQISIFNGFTLINGHDVLAVVFISIDHNSTQPSATAYRFGCGCNGGGRMMCVIGFG